MQYGEIGEECWASSCPETATHVVTTYYKKMEMEMGTAYCLKDAMYFAAWLPYCYPDEYTLISITPPASELFPKS
jgi:hypothetical protein